MTVAADGAPRGQPNSLHRLAEGDLSRQFFFEFVDQPEGLVALLLGFWRTGSGVSCGRFHAIRKQRTKLLFGKHLISERCVRKTLDFRQLNVLCAVAEFEREVIRERVNAGLAVAKAKGVRLGRPPAHDGQRSEVARLRSEGMSYRAISRELAVPVATVFELNAAFFSVIGCLILEGDFRTGVSGFSRNSVHLHLFDPIRLNLARFCPQGIYAVMCLTGNGLDLPILAE